MAIVKKDLDLKAYNVKDKFVFINDLDVDDKMLYHVSQKLRKAGALEVIFTFGKEVDLKALSNEDLKAVGLMKLTKKKLKPRPKAVH